MIENIDTRAEWREQRIEEITKQASQNIQYITGTVPKHMHPDIVSLIKQRKHKMALALAAANQKEEPYNFVNTGPDNKNRSTQDTAETEESVMMMSSQVLDRSLRIKPQPLPLHRPELMRRESHLSIMESSSRISGKRSGQTTGPPPSPMKGRHRQYSFTLKQMGTLEEIPMESS